MAFKLDSELSEKQIEADIATYFGWVTPIGSSAPFRLLDIDEQITGADKLFDRVIPIYMQFKVSDGLTRLTENPFPFSTPFPFNLKPLRRIRVFRQRETLFDNPTLYFKLRVKAKTASDFQHNILMKFANTGRSHAFYVAPLTLKKKDYERALYSSTKRYLGYPFQYLNKDIHQNGWTSYLGLVPFLRGHISIVPHEKVSTDEHYYSFSPNGTDIAWHSPRIVSSFGNRLSDRLRAIFSSAFNSSDFWYSTKEYLSIISNDSDFDFFDPAIINNDNVSEVQRLKNFGQQLYSRYEIRQILVLSSTKIINGLKI